MIETMNEMKTRLVNAVRGLYVATEDDGRKGIYKVSDAGAKLISVHDAADSERLLEAFDRTLVQFALWALRQPTAAMVGAGKAAAGAEVDVDAAWRAMVDEALR